MSQKKLKEVIKKLVQEYSGTGDAASTGLTSDDGNNVTSPRIGGSYRDAEEEIFAYLMKNKGFGGAGAQRVGDKYTGNYPNRQKFVKFEGLKTFIKKVLEEMEVEEQAYGHATLTTQGQAKSRASVPTDEYPFTARPKTRLPGVWEEDEDEKEIIEQIAGAPAGGGEDPRIKRNLKRIKDNSLENNDLGLDNERIRIEKTVSNLGKTQSEHTKKVNDIEAQIQALNSKEEQIKQFITQVSAELHQKFPEDPNLNKELEGMIDEQPTDLLDYTPEQMKQKDALNKELQKWRKQIDDIDTKKDGLIQQKSDLISANAKMAGTQSSAISKQRSALRQREKEMKKQEKEMMEELYKKYIKDRKNKDLMEYMDSYKREILLEKAIEKFFKEFDKGQTDEEIIRTFAERGVVVPEPFVKKARDQHKKLKQDKLDIENLEQETKEFKKVSMINEPEKLLSSRLFNEEIKEAKIKKRYPIPPEIKDALENKLKMKPLIRFVKNLKALNSIPPAYRIFLLNGQYFDIYYEQYSLMAKIETDEYFLADIDDRNYAIKHINRLMTKSIIKKGEEEDLGDLGDIGGGTGGSPPPPPKPPPTPTPITTPEA